MSVQGSFFNRLGNLGWLAFTAAMQCALCSRSQVPLACWVWAASAAITVFVRSMPLSSGMKAGISLLLSSIRRCPSTVLAWSVAASSHTAVVT